MIDPQGPILVGDVGGTKTSLAIVSGTTGPRDLRQLRTYRSRAYDDLATMASEYVAELDAKPLRACFGVPGPVVDGRAKLTNLPWTVDRGDLLERLELVAVDLLNDVQAAAAAVPHLHGSELHPIQVGTPARHGAIAVLAPGTGIGEAFLAWDGHRYRAHASEGGHSHFSPVTTDDAALWRYLHDRYGRVSVERVCSGSGIPDVFAFVRESGRFREIDGFADRLDQAADPTETIVDAALDATRPCPMCRETLTIFTRCLAAEAANLALKVMAVGGVYLAGGIPPRITGVLDSPAFLDPFRAMGRYSTLMKRIPVSVVLNPQAGLLGAALTGLDRLDSHELQ